MRRLPRLLAALGLGFAVAGCVSVDPPPEFDLTRLVDTAPADLRQVLVLPYGLGSGDAARLHLSIRSSNPDFASDEVFEMVRIDASSERDAERTVTSYRLSADDHRRYGRVTTRLRRALLAEADFDFNVEAFVALCDEAGVALRKAVPALLLSDRASGATIYRQTFAQEAAPTKAQAPYCI